VHAAAVDDQLLHVRHQPAQHIEERGERLGRAEEVLQVRVGRVEHHPHEGDGLQRAAQAVHFLAKAADVERRGED
jgi:hypothetical protein